MPCTKSWKRFVISTEFMLKNRCKTSIFLKSLEFWKQIKWIYTFRGEKYESTNRFIKHMKKYFKFVCIKDCQRENIL